MLREHGLGAPRPVPKRAPEAAWEDETLSWEERFCAFYRAHKPENLIKVPGLLLKYAGKEHVAYEAMLITYAGHEVTHAHTSIPSPTRVAPRALAVLRRAMYASVPWRWRRQRPRHQRLKLRPRRSSRGIPPTQAEPMPRARV